MLVIPAPEPESAVQGCTNVAHGDGTPFVRDQNYLSFCDLQGRCTGGLHNVSLRERPENSCFQG